MSSYGTPNFNSLMRLGTVSTTCSFIDSTADITDCMMVIAADHGGEVGSFGGIIAAWTQSRKFLHEKGEYKARIIVLNSEMSF